MGDGVTCKHRYIIPRLGSRTAVCAGCGADVADVEIRWISRTDAAREGRDVEEDVTPGNRPPYTGVIDPEQKVHRDANAIVSKVLNSEGYKHMKQVLKDVLIHGVGIDDSVIDPEQKVHRDAGRSRAASDEIIRALRSERDALLQRLGQMTKHRDEWRDEARALQTSFQCAYCYIPDRLEWEEE